MLYNGCNTGNLKNSISYVLDRCIKELVEASSSGEEGLIYLLLLFISFFLTYNEIFHTCDPK